MKKIIYVLLSAVVLSSCSNDEVVTPSAEFTVTIENVGSIKSNLESGVFNTPVGDVDPGPATAGKSYEFSFNAGKGHYLSFATMFVQSNDLFYAPSSMGLKLYDDMGNAITGDVTTEVLLWDAGTEVNMEPSIGSDQPPRQSGPNTGMMENGTVEVISSINDGFSYPMTASVIKAMLSHNGGTMFTLTIENISASSSLESPLAPGVYAVHNQGENPLFTTGMATTNGLEALAEDGDPSTLSANIADETGYWSPFAPGAYAIFSDGSMPIFTNGQADLGEGLEALAEDGDPSSLATSLMSRTGVSVSGAFNTPESASMPGPLLPDNSYSFTFTASEGDRLNLATMLVQSNDLFFAFDDTGVELYVSGTPISGDITASLKLWDVGTEVNEYPGAGNNQPLRQTGGNTGMDENGVVAEVNDNFNYPAINQMIKVTITTK